MPLRYTQEILSECRHSNCKRGLWIFFDLVKYELSFREAWLFPVLISDWNGFTRRRPAVSTLSEVRLLQETEHCLKVFHHFRRNFFLGFWKVSCLITAWRQYAWQISSFQRCCNCSISMIVLGSDWISFLQKKPRCSRCPPDIVLSLSRAWCYTMFRHSLLYVIDALIEV